MNDAPGLVFVSGWSTGAGTWNAVLAALPSLPVAHLDWWTALADPAVVGQFEKIGSQTLTGLSEEKFRAFVVDEIKRWADVVKRTGAALD